jgi:hypothetical protein
MIRLVAIERPRKIAMRHVVRNAQGQVQSVHLEPVPGSEPLPRDHPEVRAFVSDAEDGSEAGASFESLDAGLVRVLEDLIDALLARNILRITDLPIEAQQKLFERKSFRSSHQKSALNLFGAAQDGFGRGAPDPGDTLL